MAVVTEALAHPGLRAFSASLDVESPAEDAFALLCAVENGPCGSRFCAVRASPAAFRWV